jgi:magnesium transporter
MSFAILFHNDVKALSHVQASEITPQSLGDSNFAWMDFDTTEQQELKSALTGIGVAEKELCCLLDPDQPYYFRHHQKMTVDSLQVCSYLGEDIVSAPILIAMTEKIIITAHTGPSTYIENVLQACEESFKSVGKSPGFILFLLWDAIIDGFLPLVFSIDERLEELEEQYLNGYSSRDILDQILGCKRMVRTLKHSLSPMQRTMRSLVEIKLELISEEARQYLTGLFAHLDRLARTIDSLQDRAHSTLAGYDSVLSQQINRSMKILAVIATIMMPLSLVAAIYGTNFEYIPELNWRYSYFAFLGVLLFLGLGLLYIFRKRKWL